MSMVEEGIYATVKLVINIFVLYGYSIFLEIDERE